VEAQYRENILVIPREVEENPPNVRHLCGDALPDPKRRWKGLPSATRMQMVRLFTLRRNHKINGTKYSILITAKTGNQMNA
jgi:hypothetical protein